MASAPVVIVTGANRGIGLGIAKLLTTSKQAYTLYLTSTSGDDLLSGSSSSSTIVPVKLDVSSADDVQKFAGQVEAKHGKGRVEALINNAGINIDYSSKYSQTSVKKTLAVNTKGTAQMCHAFLPLIRKGGRIVVVASVAAHLKIYPQDIQQQFTDAATSMSKYRDFLKHYETLLEQGKELDAGFAKSPYNVSKAFVVTLTKALAAEHPDLYINCCCPGWVNTDMGSLVGKPSKTLEEGGKIPYRLAVGDIQKASGEFWENKDINSTADGHISVW